MLLEPDEIRRARERLGYSQSGLAEALHMGPNGATRVREWEQGKRGITGPASVAIGLMLAERELCEALDDLAEAARNACDAGRHPPLTEALAEADYRRLSRSSPNPVSASS